MIKTLRITSVLAALLAIAFVGISVVYGTEDDPEVDELLKAPGAVEQFEKNKGKDARDTSADAKSPLVVAAESLAKLINPPPTRVVRPPQSAGTKISRRPPKVAPKKTTAKFTVIGTCYSEIPANRCAFIDEPGQGQHWVRESDKIGHLTIKEIKDGVVVVDNGQELEEIPVVEATVVSLLDDGKGQASAPAGSTTEAADTAASDAAPSKPPVRRPGQSQASHQAALRAYWAKRAGQAAADKESSPIKASPTPGRTTPSQDKQGEGTAKPKLAPRRPLTTNQDKEEFQDILNTLRNLKEDPAAANKTPEQIAEYERVRQELMDRMTAHMSRANLRGGDEPPSLGNRNEQLGGLRSGAENND